MKPEQKLAILRHVESSPFSVRETLTCLDVPVTTYYRWRNRFRRDGIAGLYDRSSFTGKIWNELLPAEREMIMRISDNEPEWSPREIACHITDNKGFSVSGSFLSRTCTNSFSYFSTQP